jgi:hypothetical protein
MTPQDHNISTQTIKRRAKVLARQSAIAYHQALDQVVQGAGFANWQHFLNTKKNAPRIVTIPPGKASSFAEYPSLTTTRDEALAFLVRTLEYLPGLTAAGLADPRDPSSRGGDLEKCLPEIALCADWVKRLRPIRSINWRRTSYDYKHMVESWGKRREKAGDPVPVYVQNGSFIAAAVGLGYRVERANLILEPAPSSFLGFTGRYGPSGRSPNTCFNFSETTVRAASAPERRARQKAAYMLGVKPQASDGDRLDDLLHVCKGGGTGD